MRVRCESNSLVRVLLVTCAAMLGSACGPYCLERDSLRFDPAPGLTQLDSVATPDSGWRRPFRGPHWAPSKYVLHSDAFRIEFATEPLRTTEAALFVVSALGATGDSLTLEGAGVGKARPGTMIAYFVHLTEQPDTLRLTLRNVSGIVVGRVALPYTRRTHSFTCGIEWL